MNKKRALFLMLFLAIMIGVVFPFVSAQSGLPSVGLIVQKIVESIESIFAPIFQALIGNYSTGEFFFAKVLVLILLFVVIRAAVGSIPTLGENKMVVNIIAIVVSILAIRYMNENDFVRGILLPYGILGVALTTIIPFLIFFFFVHKTMESGTGRKIAWIIFMIIMCAIWFNRYDSLNNVANYIYFGVIVLAILLFLFDKNVREYFAMRDIEKATKHANEDMLIEAYHKYIKALEAAQHGYEPAKKQAERYRKFLLEHGVKNI